MTTCTLVGGLFVAENALTALLDGYVAEPLPQPRLVVYV